MREGKKSETKQKIFAYESKIVNKIRCSGKYAQAEKECPKKMRRTSGGGGCPCGGGRRRRRRPPSSGGRLRKKAPATTNKFYCQVLGGSRTNKWTNNGSGPRHVKRYESEEITFGALTQDNP